MPCNWLVLSGAEHYIGMSRNPTISFLLNEYWRHPLIFSLWNIRGRSLQFQYNSNSRLFLFHQVSIFCRRQPGDHFLNQVASMTISVAMVPKVVAACRVVRMHSWSLFFHDPNNNINKPLFAFFLFRREADQLDMAWEIGKIFKVPILNLVTIQLNRFNI